MHCLLPGIDNAATLNSNATADLIRIVLVLDRQANGAQASIADVLGVSPVWKSFPLSHNRHRFRILWDKKVPISAAAGAGITTTDFNTADSGRWFDYYRKLNIPLEFSSTTGAIGEVKSNNLFIFAISDQGSAQYEFNCRIRFTG